MRKKHINIVATFAFLTFFLGLLSLPIKAEALTLTPIRLELSGNPGDTITEQITLINERETAETYYISFSNFEAQGETGTPTFVDPKEDLGTWISGPDAVDLTPRESKIVPISIKIPADAIPGGHFAAVFWGTQPKVAKPGSVSIGMKTGVLVLLTVKGDVSEEGGITEFSTKDKVTFYTALPVDFYYRFRNSGGDRIKPAGNIVIKNMLSLTSARVPGNPVEGNVLPNSTRKIETVWQGDDGSDPAVTSDQGNFFTKAGYEWRNFAFGHYTANLSLAYGLKNQVSIAKFTFWVFPWHLTILSIVIAIIAYIVLRKLIRRYNKWVIEKAEAMLRKEAENEKKELRPKK